MFMQRCFKKLVDNPIVVQDTVETKYSRKHVFECYVKHIPPLLSVVLLHWCYDIKHS